MPLNDSLSWQQQLKSIRSDVVEREQRRATEKRLMRERNETSLRERLKEDTPEALNTRFNDIRKASDRAARKFYPLPHIEQVLSDLKDYGDLLRFYADCMKQFGKVFTPAHKTTIKKLLGELGNLQRGLDRQLRQWRELQPVIEGAVFRAKTPADDPAVVVAAKTFSDAAHNVPLSIPADFFANEGSNFYVAETEGKVFGYVKYWPEEKVVTLALAPLEGMNFKKLVRGLLHKFHTNGPLDETFEAVRVRIGFVREVKFFTDIGFVRAETKGPSDWIYKRDLV